MSHRPAPTLVRQVLIAALCLGAIHQTAVWPAIQSIFLVFLVLGVAPEFHSPLVGALWAAAAGWVLEGTLRMYPHMGGTALANMIVCLIAAWTLVQWPPLSSRHYWLRLAAFTVVHYFLVHGLVLVAAGIHTWGLDQAWALATVPLWGTLAFKLHLPHRRE